MAGFSQYGSPGFSIAPPRITPRVGSDKLSMGGLSSNTGGQAGFLGNDVNIAASKLDTSPEHMANVYMSQHGLDVGNRGYGVDRNVSGDSYGFAPQDWIDTKRFLGNPANSDYARNYQGLIGRLRQNIGGLSGFNAGEFDRFTNDLPINVGTQFGILPPTAMQNWQTWNNVPDSTPTMAPSSAQFDQQMEYLNGLNPSLKNPAYQQVLMNDRGYVYWPGENLQNGRPTSGPR